MVTGKTPSRLKFARSSIKNFLDQTYENKYLVIINHGQQNVISHSIRKHLGNNITEVIVDKKKKTLGELRNISINYVPNDAIWCCWDDDDVRSPEYLSILYKHLVDSNANAVVIKNRIDFNIKKNKAWKTTLETGFYWYMIRNHPDFRYTHLNVKEDILLHKNLTRLGNNSLKAIDNDPFLYIRIIHGENTSTYVDPTQTTTKTHKLKTLHEYELTLDEFEKTRKICNIQINNNVPISWSN
jgi:hypothetical protein